MVNDKIKKLHIVLVSRELGIYSWTGGIGTYVWDLARWLVKQGHECTVICSSYHPQKRWDEVREGVRIISLPDEQLLNKSPITYPFTFKKHFLAYRKRVADTLDKLIDSKEVDLVEFPEYGVESYIWQKRPRRIPMVVRWHTSIGRQVKIHDIIYYPLKRWMRKEVIKSIYASDAVSFNSLWTARKLEKNINFKRLFYTTIPYGVNYSEWFVHTMFKNEEAKKGLHLVYVGSLGARKGFTDLINAVKILREEGFPIILTLIGKHTGYSRAYLWKENKAIIEGWLRVLGAVSREHLGRYYASADVCCFPSRFEAFGIVCLEAMASGGIVIGSANSGMAEAIEDGYDGFLAPPKAPRELALIIKRALHLSQEEKREMRQRAREKIREKFDNEIIASQVIDFYHCVIDNFSRGLGRIYSG